MRKLCTHLSRLADSRYLLGSEEDGESREDKANGSAHLEIELNDD